MPRDTEIVIFTGAGASKPLGYPLANEFFKGWTKQPIHSWLTKHFNSNDLDVENVLALLEGVKQFHESESGKFFASFSQNSGADNSFNEVISFIRQTQERCFENYGRHPDRQKVKELYLPLLDALSVTSKAIDFFTTNYDPVSDYVLRLLETLQVRWTDGFDRLGEWLPREFDGDYQFRLFRLHGSMCYLKDRQTGRITNPRTYFRAAVPVDSAPEHILIYPGYKGTPSQENDLISYPHRYLKEGLITAKYAVFIGFAFRDDYINSVVAESKHENPALRVIIANPASMDSIKTNLPKSLTDFEHIPQGFGTSEMIEALQQR